ncbi:PLP-dependent aminotransferase family protein [Streptomyces xinghaiensis]|uniref:MocR-like pyridoxine biosynthesis transcription factor PdxR n=1 Tax=Streptomyces xinghaiensis TaxID=1038928 RepID=UPI002E0FFB5D|nr:PLP-dependent aminotransferase family protein [Streptomyces xinghaiensis]
MPDSGTTSASPGHSAPPGRPSAGRGRSRDGLWTAAWELLLPTAAAPPRQRGRTLQAALREAVRTGRLAPGTRLPSSRALAADLGVSRGLVTDAYEQLTAEGYLRGSRGSGTWVGASAVPGAHGAADAGGPAGGPGGAGTATAGPEPSGAGDPVPVADFRPGTPDLSLFPRAGWSAAQRRVLARLPHRGLGYPDPRGLPGLRRELASLLARRRGVSADPACLVVTSGVAQALTLLGLVLRDRDRPPAVALEDPGSPEHDGLFTAAGLDTVTVPVDADGPRLEVLAASGARVVVTTPAHQFPSGIAYTAERRAGLLDWARAVDGLVVEDDYDGDFRYDRAPVGALQGLGPDRVAYTGSVSKSLAPGLRLGWLVVPERLAGEVADRKRTLDLGNPALDQAALADFIGCGAYDRHLRRCQRAYRERRDTLVAALLERFPGAVVTGIAAGLHVIVRLPPRYGPQPRFLAGAAAAGVVLRPLSDFGAAPSGDGSVRLVLGYAHLPPAEIERAVRLLPTG